MTTVLPFHSDRPIDLIGVGRLCIDLNANEIYRPMEDTLSFTKYVGGSPANITIAAARLGLKTGFIGRVSDDQFGRFIIRYLKKEQIDTSSVITDRSGSVTGLAFTEIKSSTECSILMYRDNAADLKLEPDDVREAYISNSKAVLISGTALAKSPSREAVFKVLELARKHGTVVFFDIDYRPYSWASKSEVYTYCRLVAMQSDVILGGREELDLIEPNLSESQDRDDIETAKRWFTHGAKLVVVKHGSEGSIAFTPGGETVRAGVFPAKVVKTFGAGDSFAGALIYGLMQGFSLSSCLELGSASASIVVSSHSCSDAMPVLQEVQYVIAQHINR
ncbi:5-dehydro-2-deoxygluconokinase [Paenibacillus oryzisoli]|uniref:5-dehydro-2-deoxygluconokinase n=1 Tax=Paenibacillus oryzisoli TaxID=1850517 RepID=A0A197ZZW2_9BACL|nr:5-dehydro-2-deoxygluconokinase [Paenibacillus oryzisoli]OAS14392.1 5-dehydro-2-deoxygluconokinase [Paenibacillus oryzisoli]